MKQMVKNYVSEEGYKKVTDELEYRKTDLRKEIADRIKLAKEFGDLSENAAYSEARESQNENETKIQELEDFLLNVELIKKDSRNKDIQIGSSFVVELNGKDYTYSIVGSSEADPTKFKVSNESPLGIAFLDKSEGDNVKFKSPAGIEMIFKIKEII